MKRSFLFIILALFLIFGSTGCMLRPAPEADPSSTQSTSAESETSPAINPAETTVSVVPPDTTSPGDPILEMMESMTIAEKIGQLFLARCPDEGALDAINRYHLGGYILFGRDFDGHTPDSLISHLQEYQKKSRIPLLIAVDEEGGTVCRVSSHKNFRSERFPSPRSLFDAGQMDLLLKNELEKAQLLHALGINVNMAPVCDICMNPNAFMYDRSLGQSPEITSSFVEQTISIMKQNRVGSVLKHFPGYGDNTDTHTEIATDSRSLSELEDWDLQPFRAGIQAECDAILVSHTIVDCLDSVFPASLSPIVHQYLRNEMQFNGVIVTDDLIMDAIRQQYNGGQAAVMAILAGNDLLCSSDFSAEYEAVANAVNDGTISLSLLDSAVYRVLSWKENLGLLD